MTGERFYSVMLTIVYHLWGELYDRAEGVCWTESPFSLVSHGGGGTNSLWCRWFVQCSLLNVSTFCPVIFFPPLIDFISVNVICCLRLVKASYCPELPQKLVVPCSSWTQHQHCFSKPVCRSGMHFGNSTSQKNLLVHDVMNLVGGLDLLNHL